MSSSLEAKKITKFSIHLGFTNNFQHSSIILFIYLFHYFPSSLITWLKATKCLLLRLTHHFGPLNTSRTKIFLTWKTKFSSLLSVYIFNFICHFSFWNPGGKKKSQKIVPTLLRKEKFSVAKTKQLTGRKDYNAAA